MSEDGLSAVCAAPQPSLRMTRRQVADAGARWVVGAGGVATILSILAILVFISVEVVPLLQAAEARRASAFRVTDADPIVAAAGEEYREVIELITASGAIRFLSMSDGELLSELRVPGLDEQSIAVAQRAGKDQVLLATTDGRLLGLRVPFEVRYEGRKRHLKPHVVENGSWVLAEKTAPVLLGVSQVTERGVTAVFTTATSGPTLLAIRETRNLFGAVRREEVRRELPLRAGETPAAVVVDGRGTRAFVATAAGSLYYWDLIQPEQAALIDVADATQDRQVAISALAFLNGDQSVIVGDSIGRVRVWQPVRDDSRSSGWRLQPIHDFAPHTSRVTAIAASPRDKGFLSGDAGGQVLLRHATSQQTLLRLPTDAGSVRSLIFSPKANGAVALNDGGLVTNWDIVNPHPEITLKTLFGKIWYEGYPDAQYVWQSTGGTDDFEAKFSLVPLILGTVKGTLYALLFALPIAVLAALYTSQFCHPTIRNVVKPTVEIMAALPSVVLGFLAGLWLAPAIERSMPAVLAMVILLPLATLMSGVAWHAMPGAVRRRLPLGVESLLLVPLLILLGYLCLRYNAGIEHYLFGGDFPAWVQAVLGSRFDQRNCVVVGFAMGFAVIPIIFTISEDALSNVPQRLSSASLALGATPWQTALRVVLPTASPGIFSAAMIGFGRAVGETMIVLMATGNTPVLDWSIFTGMRTLSANIAVEIPEAPYGSTLYRVLFLAALLLFVSTFIVNTVAEIVRQRLRQRYQQL
jgi:phosphate transport system permease protein